MKALLTFTQDLAIGAKTSLKVAISGYLVCFVVALCFVAPMPMMFVAGDAMPKMLDLIWGK